MFITILHLGVAYFLPQPVSFINILFVVIILLLLNFESGIVVWVAFFAHFIVDLYTTSTPFGIILFSSTVSILGAFWLYQRILTNRSWYSGVALAVAALAIYRILYTGAIIFVRQFADTIAITWPELLISFFWELLFTGAAVGLIFFILSKFLPQFGGLKIRQDKSSIFRTM
ncbi:MAG: hypothetical protein WC862_05090 [Patescibacteria group bacterium]